MKVQIHHQNFGAQINFGHFYTGIKAAFRILKAMHVGKIDLCI